MDAGVPIKASLRVSQCSLVKEGDDFVLSDILGDEDHLGDMDFKVAEQRCITALQNDIKIEGIIAKESCKLLQPSAARSTGNG